MIKSKGFKGPASPTKDKGKVFAMIEDPDGYKFKLMQRGKNKEPLCQISFNVADLDRAVLFYQDVNPCSPFLSVSELLDKITNCQNIRYSSVLFRTLVVPYSPLLQDLNKYRFVLSIYNLVAALHQMVFGIC